MRVTLKSQNSTSVQGNNTFYKIIRTPIRRFGLSHTITPLQNVNICHTFQNKRGWPFLLNHLVYARIYPSAQNLQIQSRIQNLILAEYKATQQVSSTNTDFIGNIVRMMPPYHQSQCYPLPSVSSVSTDNCQYHTSATPSPLQ